MLLSFTSYTDNMISYEQQERTNHTVTTEMYLCFSTIDFFTILRTVKQYIEPDQGSSSSQTEDIKYVSLESCPGQDGKSQSGDWTAGSDQRIVSFHASKKSYHQNCVLCYKADFGITVIALEQNCMKDFWLY